jgi:uncharacterized protein
MFSLLPKYVDYFDSFERAAQNAVHCAELLADLAEKGDDPGNRLVTSIIEGEREGDKITHETLDRLEQRYFAPIDREDVYDLIWRIDDVVDRIDAAGQRMMFYKIVVVRQDFISQCAVLLKATHLMASAVSSLRYIKDRKPPTNTASVDELKIVVHQAEEEGDNIHHQFLAQLFDGQLDAFQVIKWKELYELVEQAIDYCDEVTCVVHRIVVKNG